MTNPEPKVDVQMCKDLLARMITRNQKNILMRASQRLMYLKNMKDLDENPDLHLAGAINIVDRRGPSFEAGLQIGVCMALCAREGTKHHETLRQMLGGIKEQQDGEEKGKEDGTTKTE